MPTRRRTTAKKAPVKKKAPAKKKSPPAKKKPGPKPGTVTKGVNGNTIGRKSGYRPEYYQLLIDMRREGADIYEFCGKVGISINLYYAWRDRWPDFEQAIGQADTLHREWWEAHARAAAFMPGTHTNGSLIQFLMKNKFPEYRDKQEIAETKTLEIDFMGFDDEEAQ